MTKLTKTRLIYLLLLACLVAYFLAMVGVFDPAGMSDGGGLLRMR